MSDRDIWDDDGLLGMDDDGDDDVQYDYPFEDDDAMVDMLDESYYTAMDAEEDDDDGEYVPDDDEEDEDEEVGGIRYILTGGGEDDDDDDDDESDLDPTDPHGFTRAQMMRIFEQPGGPRMALLSQLLGTPVGGVFTRPRATPAERAAERRRRRWWTPQTEPHPAGVALLRSGEFGPVGPWAAVGPAWGKRRKSKSASPVQAQARRRRSKDESRSDASGWLGGMFGGNRDDGRQRDAEAEDDEGCDADTQARPPKRLRPSERHAWRSGKYAYVTPAMHVDLRERPPRIPNTAGTVVALYPSVPYVGQFCGPDYGVFYAATQHFTLHLYSTTQPKAPRRAPPAAARAPGGPGVRYADDEFDDDQDEESDDEAYGFLTGRYRSTGFAEDASMRKIKSVRGVMGQWTITDADADRKGERMIYSSITPRVHMLNTARHDEDHHMLDFAARYGRRDGGFIGGDAFGIWSIRFSADGKEVVAGASSGNIMVYDIAADRPTLTVAAHNDDVNAVCFADQSSTNILVSGSDDGYVKVWDRRSLSSSTPSGVLVGATEGITYTAPKGDGRYVVANSKDQAARLYDLRKMRAWSEFEDEHDAVARFGQKSFDYRTDRYAPPRGLAHPRDCSVMTYRGHSVLRTLIRCHFSPAESTGQSYIYSGSADGLIHIWSLDGRVVQVLNRAESLPLHDRRTGRYTDPSGPEPSRRAALGADAFEGYGRGWTVRDVAWHGYEPTLMSTCWEVEGQRRNGGSVARHEWKGLGKGGLRMLEDWVEKAAREEESRPAQW